MIWCSIFPPTFLFHFSGIIMNRVYKSTTCTAQLVSFFLFISSSTTKTNMSCFLENWLACCEFSKRMKTHHFQINRNYFWTKLWFTAGETIKFKQFIRKKNIVLHEDDARNNSSVRTIGLDPEYQFNVFAMQGGVWS